MALTTKLLRLSIAKECGVSRNFVRKVIDELHLNGGRVLRSTEQEERESAENSALCKLSSFVVFRLYLEEPSTNLDSYRESLYRYTGISVSNASIERFFIDHFLSGEPFVSQTSYRMTSSSPRTKQGWSSTSASSYSNGRPGLSSGTRRA